MSVNEYVGLLSWFVAIMGTIFMAYKMVSVGYQEAHTPLVILWGITLWLVSKTWNFK